jgi:hypothetical protein
MRVTSVVVNRIKQAFPPDNYFTDINQQRLQVQNFVPTMFVSSALHECLLGFDGLRGYLAPCGWGEPYVLLREASALGSLHFLRSATMIFFGRDHRGSG